MAKLKDISNESWQAILRLPELINAIYRLNKSRDIQ